VRSCIRRIYRRRCWWHVPVLRDLGVILPLLMGTRVLLYACRRTGRCAIWRLWPGSCFTTRLCPQLLYYCSLALLWTSLLANRVECAVQIVTLAAVAWPTIVASYFSPSTGITRQFSDGTAACHLQSRDAGIEEECRRALGKTASRTDMSVKWFERDMISPLYRQVTYQVLNHTAYVLEV
jgi:hypothetical protein